VPQIRLWSNGTTFDVETLGVLTPKPVEIEQLVAGEVGFMIANIKNVADTKIGDTITDDAAPALEALPGFEDVKPMVFAGLYTVDSHEHTLCAKPWKNCA
jgi:GTP-binding protein LepA